VIQKQRKFQIYLASSRATTTELDLRGFLGIDPNLKPGYDSLRYVVRIKGNGTAEQFEEIHQNIIKKL
jgi:hypothetical protein